MTDDEVKALIERAAGIVGTNPPANKGLRAEDGAEFHKQELMRAVAEKRASEADVKPLLDALGDPKVVEVLHRYNANNAEAKEARQGIERGWLLIVLLLGFALATTVTISMLPHGKAAEWLHSMGLAADMADKLAYLGPRWFVFAVLLLVPLMAFRLDPERNDATWREARGTAEALRRKLFEQILVAPEAPQGGAVPALLLKLEHFRRYQLEVQHAYYTGSAADNRRTAARAKATRYAFLMALLFWSCLWLAVSIAGRAEQAVAPFGWAADATLAGTAMLLNSFEAMELDHLVLPLSLLIGIAYASVLIRQYLNASLRNAFQYEHAAANLSRIAVQIDDVRRRAARGDREAVRAFVQRVHAVMSQEHADWVRLAQLDLGQGAAGSQAAE